MQGKRVTGGLVAACIWLACMAGAVGFATEGESIPVPQAAEAAYLSMETQAGANSTESVDYYAKAQSSFARARKLFGEIADHCEGSLKKSASSAMQSAKAAESAVKDGNLRGAHDAASRAKLDAVLTAATAQKQDSINAAIREFDTQISAYASAPDEKKAEQLAKVADKLSALAKALKANIISEEVAEADKKT